MVRDGDGKKRGIEREGEKDGRREGYISPDIGAAKRKEKKKKRQSEENIEVQLFAPGWMGGCDGG